MNFKSRIRTIWDAFVALVHKLDYDTLLYLVAGLVTAAFFSIGLHMKACIVPALFAGFAKEFFDLWTTDSWNWGNFAAVAAGGAVIQLFQIIAL